MRHWLAPALASLALAGLIATFATEMTSFRRAVEEWAVRDLDARTALAAENLKEPLKTGDFRQIYAFGAACEAEGLQLTIYSSGGGIFYNSQALARKAPVTHPDRVYRTAQSGDFTVRLGLTTARVLAPFRRARTGFLLAALAGGAGMLFVFFFTYRQHVRIRELARLEQFQRDFVADVSHELKTPLTGILGAADMLADGGTIAANSPAGTLVTMIRREAHRLNTLAQGILDLARLERAEESIQKVPTDLNDLLKDIATRLAPQAEAKGINLQCDAASDSGGPSVTIQADGQMLDRAIANLVTNAIRYSDSPDIILRHATNAHEAQITVEDHGRGIPPEETARIFERFRRLDPARAAETGGAGLGLAIVRRIAQLHGGTVTLKSSHPGGCRFTISLPL